MPWLQRPQVLVVIVNDFPHNAATLPAKVAEALCTANPVLGIGPVPGDLTETLAGASDTCGVTPSDVEGQRRFFQTMHRRWCQNDWPTVPRDSAQWSRKAQAAQLVSVLSEAVSSS